MLNPSPFPPSEVRRYAGRGIVSTYHMPLYADRRTSPYNSHGSRFGGMNERDMSEELSGQRKRIAVAVSWRCFPFSLFCRCFPPPFHHGALFLCIFWHLDIIIDKLTNGFSVAAVANERLDVAAIMVLDSHAPTARMLATIRVSSSEYVLLVPRCLVWREPRS